MPISDSIFRVCKDSFYHYKQFKAGAKMDYLETLDVSELASNSKNTIIKGRDNEKSSLE